MGCDCGDCTSMMLHNLLARIHGDGGHYTEEHGLDKSANDAELLVARSNLNKDSLMKQIAMLRIALERIAAWRGCVTGEVIKIASNALVTVPPKGHEACTFPCPECDPNMFISGKK